MRLISCIYLVYIDGLKNGGEHIYGIYYSNIDRAEPPLDDGAYVHLSYLDRTYLCGKIHGLSIERYDNNPSFIDRADNYYLGKKHGECIEYITHCLLEYKIRNYNHGIKHGRYTSHINHEYSTKEYINGKLNGKAFINHSKWRNTRVDEYLHGKLHGKCLSYSWYKLPEKMIYRDGIYVDDEDE